MKYRTRTSYSASQKALTWERWKQGQTLHQIAGLFRSSPWVGSAHLAQIGTAAAGALGSALGCGGLCAADGRRTAGVQSGRCGHLMREEPTVRHALQSMVRYGRLQNVVAHSSNSTIEHSCAVSNKVADDLFLKVIAHRVPPHLITRPRLLSDDEALRGYRVILVQAPAGFGKTSLLAQWRKEHLAHGAMVAWVSAQARDDTQPLVRSGTPSLTLRFFDAMDQRSFTGVVVLRPHHRDGHFAGRVLRGRDDELSVLAWHPHLRLPALC
jgi:hypothetical protein